MFKYYSLLISHSKLLSINNEVSILSQSSTLAKKQMVVQRFELKLTFNVKLLNFYFRSRYLFPFILVKILVELKFSRERRFFE